jgi:hypothetical protein
MLGLRRLGRELAPLAVLSLSCTGTIEGQAPAGGLGQAPGVSNGAGEPAGEPVADARGNLAYVAPTPADAALPGRTWKLTHEQYRRSVQSFLGVDVVLVDESGAPRLEPEVTSGVFRNMALSGFVSVALAEDYQLLAEELSAGLGEAQFLALNPCGALDATCRDAFLQTAIARAFRRPASAEDLARFGGLFDIVAQHAAALSDPAAGFRAVIEGLLTSPYFLYRTEIGSDAAQPLFQLAGHEVASFLSFSILNEPPSTELLDAAARGELTDATLLAPAVQQLLETPAAATQLSQFMHEWLDVVEFSDPEVVRKDIEGFDAVRVAMLQETSGFLLQHGGLAGSLSALLTTPLALPAGPLGVFYTGEPSGAAADQRRTGLLALGTVLSTHAKEAATSPTLRGLFLRNRLLCQDFQVPAVIPDISETQNAKQPKTTRELYQLHATEPACSVCHKLIDGLGFTFENLDAVGRFRSQQNGEAIVTHGELLNTDVNQPLADHTELAQALSRSEWARECFSRQAFRFYFGLSTSTERSADGTRLRENRGLPPIQAGRLALAGAGTIRDLLGAILSSPSTLSRTRVDQVP